MKYSRKNSLHELLLMYHFLKEWRKYHSLVPSKGKGFQGAVKRFHLAGGPKTHGSKFHRHVGSLGNRKPRRVQKGHPHAGHMGTDTVTLHNRPVAEIITVGDDKFIAVK